MSEIFNMIRDRLAEQFSILFSNQHDLLEQTEDFINNLPSRSVMINTTGEKERNKFFNRVEENIERAKKILV